VTAPRKDADAVVDGEDDEDDGEVFFAAKLPQPIREKKRAKVDTGDWSRYKQSKKK